MAFMGQNRILGSPYASQSMAASVPGVEWGFTTNWTVDLYLVQDDGVHPALVTLDPGAVPGDVVAIQDATGNSSIGKLLILASPGQTINLHPAGFVNISAANGVIRAVLTMGENNVWFVAFMGGP